MTDHADTISRTLSLIAPQGMSGDEGHAALAALDALLAERQQAQEERDQIARDYEWAWEQRQQAIDALRRAREDIGLIAETSFDMGMDGRIRRAERSCERIDAALVKLGEQP